MSLVRDALSAFALANAAIWAALACAWAFRPQWAERLPLKLGTHERYRKAAPAWARLAAALAGFWTVAAALYLKAGLGAGPAPMIVLFVLAAAFLLVAIVAAGAVYRALQPPSRLPLSVER
ncbi:MAG TPA: hypothetical protein VET65_10590 [Candidatus Limnocylindrales bacterium]|nr:hypothetical protein [Candidatus Limnocylindrales bacterium]